jgi:hypothetical protein
MNERSSHLQGLFKNLSWTGLISVGVLLIPLAVWLGLQVFGTAPNPRHPPIDLKEEALGWTLVAAFFGLAGAVIAESAMMRERTGFWGQHRGLIVGTVVALVLGCFFAVAMAIITRSSVDGQGITSTQLAVAAGLLVGMVGAVAGVFIGAGSKRIVNYFTS